MASDRPSRDITLSVNPNAQTAMNEARTETGRASPVMTVDRQEFKKTKTTRTVRIAPSISALPTSQTDCRTRVALFLTTSSDTPSGNFDRSRSIRSMTLSATSVVL